MGAEDKLGLVEIRMEVKDIKPRGEQHKIKVGEKTSELECEIVRETEKALLIKHNDINHWFPFSTIHSITRKQGCMRHGTIVCDTWILVKKGLE
jgi:hypothetical protein